MADTQRPCTLEGPPRDEVLELLRQLDMARGALSDRLGQLADEWDDQLAAHPGDVAAEDRLEALIRWRDELLKSSTIPEAVTGGQLVE